MGTNDSAKKLSVIIVSYNCLEYLKDCLRSVKEKNDIGEALEIIVVDNSTDDETVKYLRREEKDIVCIPNENRGFGQGNNVGAAVAGGDILLFLNPDTVLTEPVFGWALERFEADPSLGLFGVELVGPDGKRNSSYGLRMPLGLVRTTLCNVLVFFRVFIPRIMYSSGADIFVRKKAFFDAGCFDENFFMYCEEADLLNRVNALGLKNGYYRDKKIIHLEGKTLQSNLYSTYTRQMKSRKYYCEKYGLDFSAFAGKERAYCRLKAAANSLLGKKDRSREYARIVKYWDAVLSESKEDPAVKQLQRNHNGDNKK